MGYFPNGSAGMDYEQRFCARCVNYRDAGDGRGQGCPIWDLHLLWNYDACNGKSADKDSGTRAKFEALEHFIPHTKDGLGNEQCAMFHEGDADNMPDPAEERRKLLEWNALYGKPAAVTQGGEQ